MSRAETWLAEAEADLETAVKALLFALHQAPWGHAVGELLDRVAAQGVDVPENLREVAHQLDLHYIPSRYPDALPAGTPSGHCTRGMGESALKCAKSIVAFATTQVLK